MNQQQSIGSNNQHQGLPPEKNEDTKPRENEKLQPGPHQPEKPAITNDEGNIVDRNTNDAGKGYSEKKPTETWSDEQPADDTTEQKSPEKQHKASEKVYGDESSPNHSNIQHDNNFTHQPAQEEKDSYEKRVRQSGDVAG